MGDFFLRGEGGGVILYFPKTPKLCVQKPSITSSNCIQHLSVSVHVITCTMLGQGCQGILRVFFNVHK